MKACDEKLKAGLCKVMEQKEAELNTEMQNVEPHVFSEKFEKKMAKILNGEGPEDLDEIIRECILKIMDDEEAALDKEMENMEPHVFSEEFERKMEKVFEVVEKKSRRHKGRHYIAAAIVTVLLIGGILFVGNEEIRASKIGVNVLEWMGNFFVVEEKSLEGNDALFEESQIGYLPEGFEKVEELVSFSKVYYKYENNEGKYIVLEIHRDKTELIVDNEEIEQEVSLNEAGLEYRYIYKDDSKENILIWKDAEDIYYQLQSTYDKEEIVKIMNGISY